MADQRSVEMLAFNFASRTFAYKGLAQGLSRSVSAFSSFMRENLDPVDQCAEYVDDIGIAAKNETVLPGTFGQSSSAFAKQDWNWQLKHFILESDKLSS